MSAPRSQDGSRIHDGALAVPAKCARGRSDCEPLARIASPGFESFMCCGETDAAPVPTDKMRLCILSTHASGVNLLVNFDERDAVDTASVLLGGLSALAQDRADAAYRLAAESPNTPDGASSTAGSGTP